MEETNFNNLRKNYYKGELLEKNITKNPFDQFNFWFKNAVENTSLEANAMVLSTVSSKNIPSSRVVLLKEIKNDNFVFYTNYLSRKSQQIEENPYASLLFFWQELEQQIRIEGSVCKTSVQDSEDYFQSRPNESKIAAWASLQSTPIKNRTVLEEKFQYFKNVFQHNEIPRPENWGGWSLKPFLFEFWQGRPNRLHDRIQYKKENNEWIINRLCP